MKQILVFLITIGSFNFSMGEEINISVKGMVCGFCAQGITKKFKELPELETVDVSLEKKLVHLKTKGSATLPDSTISKILTDSGYNVEKIEHK